jgi:hypothetical protein
VPSTYLTLLKSLCIIDVGFGLVGTLGGHVVSFGWVSGGVLLLSRSVRTDVIYRC